MMNIEIKIQADSVEAARAAFAQLAGGHQAPHVTVLAKDPRIEGGELTIPAGTDLTVTSASSDPAAESMKAPEKPKRTRKATAKTPESAQAAAVAQETPQPERVTPEPEKPAEAPQDAPEPGAPQYGDPAAAPTIDQIAAAGAKLLDEDANKMSALLDLLGKYGVQAITQLKPEQLAGFAADLRALGAGV